MAIAKRKKKFFDVEIPLINKQTQLLAYEFKDVDGRFIKYDLTRILKGKSAVFSGKVSVKGEKATVIPYYFRILPYFLRRMVRKGTNYVEDSFLTECKDAIIRIKPFLITRRKVSRAVRKALREKAKEELINYAKTKTAESIFKDIISNQLQKPLSLKLKKIYPLSLCEIRILKVEKYLEPSEKSEGKQSGKSEKTVKTDKTDKASKEEKKEEAVKKTEKAEDSEKKKTEKKAKEEKAGKEK